MTALRLVVLARRVPLLSVVVAAMTGLAWLFYRDAIEIDLDISPFAPTHTIPVPELIAVVTGILGAAVTRPRFWEWERLGGLRTRVVAVALAALVIAAPLLPALVGVHTLPDGVAWSWLVSNVLTMSATTLLLSAVLGPALGGGAGLAGYVGIALVDNLVAGARPLLPLAAHPAEHGKWLPPLILIPVALLVHAYTRGLSTWAHRLDHNET